MSAGTGSRRIGPSRSRRTCAERAVRCSSTSWSFVMRPLIHLTGGALNTLSRLRVNASTSADSDSTRRSVSTSAFPSARLPRPSPMKSRKFASRRCSAPSSASFNFQRLRGVGTKPRDLLLDLPEDVPNLLRTRDLTLHSFENDLLCQRPADEQLVVAGSLGRGEAAVVATALAADLHARGAAAGARHRPASRCAGKCFCRLPWFLEKPRFRQRRGRRCVCSW
jgi:hypothetical protein